MSAKINPPNQAETTGPTAPVLHRPPAHRFRRHGPWVILAIVILCTGVGWSLTYTPFWRKLQAADAFYEYQRQAKAQELEDERQMQAGTFQKRTISINDSWPLTNDFEGILDVQFHEKDGCCRVFYTEEPPSLRNGFGLKDLMYSAERHYWNGGAFYSMAWIDEHWMVTGMGWNPSWIE